MQSETPETEVHIQITPALRAAIGKVAAAYGLSVDAWIVRLLQVEVPRTQQAIDARESAEEEQRNQKWASEDKATQDMLDKHSGRHR
jgi:hypothetical protein